jgi:flagellar protein FlgJ
VRADSPEPSQSPAEQRLLDASRDFEAVFVRQLLAVMEQTLENGLFGAGAAGDIYSDFLNGAIADGVARNGGIGFADALYRQIAPRLDTAWPER